MDILTELANSILAIKSDPVLKRTFLDILEMGSFTQQVRVDKLYAEVAKYNPPPEVMHLLALLKDDKIANLIYAELSK